MCANERQITMICKNHRQRVIIKLTRTSTRAPLNFHDNLIQTDRQENLCACSTSFNHLFQINCTFCYINDTRKFSAGIYLSEYVIRIKQNTTSEEIFTINVQLVNFTRAILHQKTCCIISQKLDCAVKII